MSNFFLHCIKHLSRGGSGVPFTLLRERSQNPQFSDSFTTLSPLVCFDYHFVVSSNWSLKPSFGRYKKTEMAQSTVKLAFSTLLGILGWHGVFLLFLIIALKLFLWERYQEYNTSCPCTWNVAYGTIMFLFPSLTSYMIAVFAYFRQDSNSAPWKVLKKFYVIKYSCPYYDERTEWDFHADHCLRCRRLRHDWSLVKIAVSAVFSFLYPLVWLSLSFLQTAYYVCANVGPSSDILQNVCDVNILKPDDYRMAYGLAAIRSKTIGSILFVCTLFFVGVFLILYGEMKSYLSKKFDWDPSGKGASNNLLVQLCIQPGRTSGSAETASLHSNRDTPVAMDSGAAENGRLVCICMYVSRGFKLITRCRNHILR